MFQKVENHYADESSLRPGKKAPEVVNSRRAAAVKKFALLKRKHWDDSTSLNNVPFGVS